MNEFETALLAVLASIDQRLEALVDAGATTAPNYQRRLADFLHFNWPAIGATVLEADEFGPAAVEWRGLRYTRRSPQNKFDAAIWFSRAAGKDEDGTVRYERLITFKEQAEPEPLSRKLADELAKVADGRQQMAGSAQNGTGVHRTPVPETPVLPATPPVPTAGPLAGAAAPIHTGQPENGPAPVLAPPAASPPAALPPQTAKPANGTPTATAPIVRTGALPPEQLKRWLAQETVRFEKRAVQPSILAATARTMAAIVPDADRRHELDEWLTGYHSMKDMPGPWLMALHAWLKPSREAEPTDRWARDEVALVLDLLNSQHLASLAATNPASRYAPAAPEQKEML